MGEYQIIAMAAGMFFEFGIKDFIDILLVAFLLYYVYKLMKASGSIKDSFLFPVKKRARALTC